MSNKHDPILLMMQTALLIKLTGKMAASVDGAEDFKEFRIEIEMKGQEQKPLIISDDRHIKVGIVLITQGNKVFSEDILEKRKDELGRVLVYYKGKKHISFDSFEEHVNWLGID